MYCSFFGLKKLPFKISPDLTFFYKQAAREEITQALLFSIERGDGIITVTGEVGVGKTTLLRLLSDMLPDNYIQVYISSPNLSAEALLKFICSELAISVNPEDGKADLMNRLNRFLIDEYRQNRRVVMLVDEAQAMMLDTLEEIRLLGNLETADDKLLQMVLFGQPELDVTLQDPRVRPFKDRIANHFTIQPLNDDEVMHYLNYRMRVAGYMQADLFTMKMAKRIRGATGGLPRSINLLADKLLMVAFSKGDTQLKTSHLNGLFSSPSSGNYRLPFGIAASLGGVAVILALWWGNAAHDSSSVSQTPEKALAWQQASQQLLDAAERLGVSGERLVQLTDMDRQARHFLKSQAPAKPLILINAMPLQDFDDVYSKVLNGLELANRAHLFALIDTQDKSSTIQFRLLYDPRAKDGASLQTKQTDLKTLSGGTPRIVSVSNVEEMIAQPLSPKSFQLGLRQE